MPDTLILCSTARLARSLRLAYDRQQYASGLRQWQPLPVLTLSQWLKQTLEQALLCGDITLDRVPHGVLSGLQERMLWEDIISSSLAGDAASALFDVAGLAQAALEANALMVEWNLQVPPSMQTEESRQFLTWREEFQRQCAAMGWLEAARYTAWQLDVLEAGAGEVPYRIQMAGFDRLGPYEHRLIAILEARGVQVERYETGLGKAGQAAQLMLETQEEECRAAVAWAAGKLREDPEARLGIVVPELAHLRQALASLLDDVLHPETVRPALVEAPRRYDFSLGLPVASHPLVVTALRLLRLFSQYKLSQEEVSVLLMQPYWSAGVSEANGRARLDARMREWLPLTITLRRLLRLISRLADPENGLPINNLLAHMQAATAVKESQPGRQLPSLWATAFQRILDCLEWPGERSLSSHEFQAKNAFSKTLQALAALDVLGRTLTMPQALQRLSELCREQIFQPEVEGEPQLQVMGMLEGASSPLDGLWVMGMNDHVWPPPPRPNPLLPAHIQRAAGVPNAHSSVQAEFAETIHQRILKSASEVVFSWACRDGERPLRPSPLLVGIALGTDSIPQAVTLAEILASQGEDIVYEEDHMAPPVLEGERVSGGTGLLKAQAICPAWAYFQYRLGARALKPPVNGLEAAERGTLVHYILQHFWRERAFADLQNMNESALKVALADAAETAMQEFDSERDEPLPEDFMLLEKERLVRLAHAWLQYEKTREVDFRVLACEQERTVTIEGIEIRLVIDRIDALEDGRLVIMDYKTGQKPDIRNWAQSRITEPQLPIYAAFTLDDQEAAAICFAMVRTDEHVFAGLAANDVLPNVLLLEDKKCREIFSVERFADWQGLQAHWRKSLQGIAREIRAGEAAVRFDDEKQLAYCEVLPLLRLPERRLQFERVQLAEGKAHA